MKTKITAILAVVMLLTGYVTDDISVKTILDPNATHAIDSKIFVDAQTDMPIEKRKYFVEVAEIVRELGYNVVNQEDADYVLFFKFKRGMEYDAKHDNFEFHFHERYDYMGILDAGLFKMTEDKKSFIGKSQWEGYVDVKDIRDRESLKASLDLILSNLMKDVALDQPIEDPKS